MDAMKVSTPEELKTYWQDYEGMALLDIFEEWDYKEGFANEVAVHFIRVMHKAIEQDELVTAITRSFSANPFDLDQAIRNSEIVRTKLSLDNYDERVMLYDVQDYLGKFKALAPRSVKIDEENWQTFTDEDYQEATEHLESIGQLVCGRTIKTYLIKKYQSGQ